MYPILKSDYLHKPKFIGKHRITLRRKNSATLWRTLAIGLLILVFLLVGSFILGKDSFFKEFWGKSAQLLLHQCDAHLEQQAFEQAKQCYQELLSLDNQHPIAKTRLAEIQNRSNLSKISNEPNINEPNTKPASLTTNSPILEQSQHELPKASSEPLSNNVPSMTSASETYQLSSIEPTNSSQLSTKKLHSQPDQLKKEPKIQAIAVNSTITIDPIIAVDPITIQLQNCLKHFKANRLTSGQPETAFDCYRDVLKQQPHNIQAKAGLKKIEQRYRTWAKRALNQRQLDKAAHYLQKLQQVNPNASDLNQLRKQLDLLKMAPPAPSPSHNSARQEKRPSTNTVSQESAKPSEVHSREKNEGAQPKVEKKAQPTVSPTPKTRLPPVPKTLSLPSNVPSKPATGEQPEHFKPNLPQKQTIPTQPARCGEIFTQESLGIQPLTNEQKFFKIEYCH